MRPDLRKWLLCSAIAALMTAGASCQCGPDEEVTDGGTRRDSGVVVNPVTDAGGGEQTVDSGIRDSGAAADAGLIVTDGGLVTDGGVAAGDAGMSFDAGVFDAGCLAFSQADGGCLPLVFSNLCELTQVTVVHDSDVFDDSAGTLMGSAISAACPATSIRTLNWRDGGVIDAMGVPLLAANDALVCAGGSFGQRHVAWLESSGRSPVYDSSIPPLVSLSLRDGGVVFNDTEANIGASHDYFVIQLVHSGPGLPVSVAGYGFLGGGTTASAWYFGNVLLPARATLEAGWYVVEWLDGDSSGSANNANEFTLLGSGH